MGAEGWKNIHTLAAKQYRCAYCDQSVASQQGLDNVDNLRAIRVCPLCGNGTYLNGGKQFPSPHVGGAVRHLATDVEAVFQEARAALSASAPTACVLACRKILMHIGVERGAKPNQTFAAYVDQLAKDGFIPPNGKGWVDHIRQRGNEANHEIKVFTNQEATEVLVFTEMLLRFIYELPGLLPPAATKP
jgi:hypothetical protein